MISIRIYQPILSPYHIPLPYTGILSLKTKCCNIYVVQEVLPDLVDPLRVRAGVADGRIRITQCVIGILVDYGGMYFEVNIANHDLARKTLLKSAVVHIVVFFITCVIYHVKCKEEVLMEKMVEGPSGKPQY